MKSPAWIKISAGGRSAGCISLCLSWVSDIATILTFFLLGYIFLPRDALLVFFSCSCIGSLKLNNMLEGFCLFKTDMMNAM